jgi:hypothetical protein
MKYQDGNYRSSLIHRGYARISELPILTISISLFIGIAAIIVTYFMSIGVVSGGGNVFDIGSVFLAILTIFIFIIVFSLVQF